MSRGERIIYTKIIFTIHYTHDYSIKKVNFLLLIGDTIYKLDETLKQLLYVLALVLVLCRRENIVGIKIFFFFCFILHFFLVGLVKLSQLRKTVKWKTGKV